MHLLSRFAHTKHTYVCPQGRTTGGRSLTSNSSKQMMQCKDTSAARDAMMAESRCDVCIVLNSRFLYCRLVFQFFLRTNAQGQSLRYSRPLVGKKLARFKNSKSVGHQKPKGNHIDGRIALHREIHRQARNAGTTCCPAVPYNITSAYALSSSEQCSRWKGVARESTNHPQRSVSSERVAGVSPEI